MTNKKNEKSTRTRKHKTAGRLLKPDVAYFFQLRRSGLTIHKAAAGANIDYQTLYRWKDDAHEKRPVNYATPEEQAEYLYKWESATVLLEATLLHSLIDNAQGNINGKPEAAKFMLTVIDPQRYAIKQQLEVSTDPTAGLQAVINAAFKMEGANDSAPAPSESHKEE